MGTKLLKLGNKFLKLKQGAQMDCMWSLCSTFSVF